MLLKIPLPLPSRANRKLHWSKIKNQRDRTRWDMVLFLKSIKWELPLLVTITRVAPGRGLDDDNLAMACKSVRDGVADALGVDDRDRDIVRYAYKQRNGTRGEYAVEIEVGPLERCELCNQVVGPEGDG